jgi:hypothetical protein
MALSIHHLKFEVEDVMHAQNSVATTTPMTSEART